LRSGDSELDIGELGPVERARRTLEIAIDGQRGALLLAAQFGRDEIGAVRRRYLRLGRCSADWNQHRAKPQGHGRSRPAQPCGS